MALSHRKSHGDSLHAFDDKTLGAPRDQNASTIRDKSTTHQRHALVDALAEAMLLNIDSIIGQIDSIAQDADLANEASSQSTRKRKPLVERWRFELRKVKNVYSGRNFIATRKPYENMTVEELWEGAFSSIGMDHRILPSETPQLPRQNGMSPIFGMPIDHEGCITMNDQVLEQVCGDNLEAETYVDEVALSESITETLNESSPNQELLDCVHRSIALLSSIRVEEWASFDAVVSSKIREAKATEEFASIPKVLHERNLLDHSHDSRYTLSTNESNLLLAYLLTSPTKSIDEILERSLEVHHEMTNLSSIHRHDGGPDNVTHRLLFLALPRRLMATGEAMKICQTMAGSSSNISPETCLEAMRVCDSYKDLGTARKLINQALERGNRTSRPSLGSFIIMMHMFTSQNLMDEAMTTFDKIQESKILDPEEEDELLFKMCHWATKSSQSRSGKRNHMLVRILDILSTKVTKGENPRLPLWLSLIDKLSLATDFDHSKYMATNKAIRTVLHAYPTMQPGPKLLSIGLRIAPATGDIALVSDLIARQVATSLERSIYSKSPGVDESAANTVRIPQQIFKKALEMCIQQNDVDSASSILQAIHIVDESYPVPIKLELHSLVVLCHARAGNTKEAKKVLFSMVDKGMKPEDELFGAVLHSLVVSGDVEDAKELFQSMTSDQSEFVRPGVSSFNAILLSHIQAHAWDDAILLAESMEEEKKIVPNAQTVQGLLLAYRNRDGKKGAVTFLEKALDSNNHFDEKTFKLAAKILVAGLDGTLDEVRAQIRTIGEKESRLRKSSLELIRSARVAEVEEKKSISKREGDIAMLAVKNSSNWRVAVGDLLGFSRELDQNE